MSDFVWNEIGLHLIKQPVGPRKNKKDPLLLLKHFQKNIIQLDTYFRGQSDHFTLYRPEQQLRIISIYNASANHFSITLSLLKLSANKINKFLKISIILCFCFCFKKTKPN